MSVLLSQEENHLLRLTDKPWYLEVAHLCLTPLLGLLQHVCLQLVSEHSQAIGLLPGELLGCSCGCEGSPQQTGFLAEILSPQPISKAIVLHILLSPQDLVGVLFWSVGTLPIAGLRADTSSVLSSSGPG